MFTGLVEERGTWASQKPKGQNAEALVRVTFGDLALGESIAIDGCCLTVREIVSGGFVCDVSKETLARTTLSLLSAGSHVNIERAMAVGARLGGHIVSGHVDGVGECTRIENVDGASLVTFSFPRELARFIAEKGSICVSGVSLTVNRVGSDGKNNFDVMLIPHTQDVTTLRALKVGSRVNLEVDLFARYVARMLDVARDERNPLAGGTDKSDDAWTKRLARFVEDGARNKSGEEG